MGDYKKQYFLIPVSRKLKPAFSVVEPIIIFKMFSPKKGIGYMLHRRCILAIALPGTFFERF